MKKYIIIFFGFIILISCSDKFDITQFDQYTGNINIGGDTLYILNGEAWSGFNNPRALLMGKEPFIYVCDTDNNRIVMLDIAGQWHGALSIKNPIAIAQDYNLNLYVCAEFDTANVTYSALYKINLYAAGHQIENAVVTRILPLRDSDFNLQRKYTAVTVFYDNSIYLARTGPNNSSISNPDNSIFKIAPKKLNAGGDIIVPLDKDTLTIGRVPFIDPLNRGLISANGINSMTSFNKKNIDFIATLAGESSFKAQWFYFYSSGIEERYYSKFDPVIDGVAFVKPNRFLAPTGSCIDPAGNIFVADAGRDSVLKFNSNGVEMHSFGGPDYFVNPVGVAFFDKVLYVLDAGKNQILRFKLSTDTQ